MVSAPASPVKAHGERPKVINKRHTLAPSRGILKPFTQSQMNHEGNHMLAIMPMKEPFKHDRDETIRMNRRVSFAPEVTLHKIKMVPSLPSPPPKLPRRRETIHFIPPPKELLSSAFQPEEEDGGRNILSDSSEEDMELDDDDDNLDKVSEAANNNEEEPSMDETELVSNNVVANEEQKTVEDEVAMDMTVVPRNPQVGEFIEDSGVREDEVGSKISEGLHSTQPFESEAQEEVAMNLTPCVASLVETKDPILDDENLDQPIDKESNKVGNDNNETEEESHQVVAMELTQRIPVLHEEIVMEMTQAVPVYEDKPSDDAADTPVDKDRLHEEKVPVYEDKPSDVAANASVGRLHEEKVPVYEDKPSDVASDASVDKGRLLEEEVPMEMTQHLVPETNVDDAASEAETSMELTQPISKLHIPSEDEKDMELTQNIQPATAESDDPEHIEEEEEMELTQNVQSVTEKLESPQRAQHDSPDQRVPALSLEDQDMELTQIHPLNATPEKGREPPKRASSDSGSPDQKSPKRQKMDQENIPATPPRNSLEASLMSKINSLTPRRRSSATFHSHQTQLAEPLFAYPVNQPRREEAVTTTIPLADVSTSSIQEDDYTPVTLKHFMDLIGVKFYDDLHVKDDVFEYSQFTTQEMSSPIDYVCAFPQLPILELQSFSCKELRKNVEEGQNIFTQLEADTAEDNSPLMREFMEADPAVQRNMMLQFQTIKSFSREQAQSLWYSWRIQLMEGVFSSISKNETKVKQDFEEVSRKLKAKEDENEVLEQKAEVLLLRLAKLVKHKTEFQNCDRNSLLQLREELIRLTDSILERQKDIQQLEVLQAEIKDRVSEQLVRMDSLKQDIELKRAQMAKLKVFDREDIFNMKEKFSEMLKAKQITDFKVNFPLAHFEFDRSIRTIIDLKTGMGSTNMDMLQKGASRGGAILIKFLQEGFDVESKGSTGREYMRKVLQLHQDSMRVTQQFRLLELKYPVTVTRQGSDLNISAKLVKKPSPQNKSIASWTVSQDSIKKGILSGPISVKVIKYGSREVSEDSSLDIDFMNSVTI